MTFPFGGETRYKSGVRLLLAIPLTLVACASAPKEPGRYPPQKEGCEVQVFPESPSMDTDNIGTVNATCGDDVSDDACLRTLKDEACKLGADVVWGVADKPSVSLGKKKLSGRAAHTKGQSAPRPNGT